MESAADAASLGTLLTRIGDAGGRYQCDDCGLHSVGWYWRCPKCRSWDSMRPAVFKWAERTDDAVHAAGMPGATGCCRAAQAWPMKLPSPLTRGGKIDEDESEIGHSHRRVSCGRAWHALPAGHQGEPEGDAAGRRQAAHPVRGGGGAGRRARAGWCSSPAPPSGPSRTTSTPTRSSSTCSRRRARATC